MDKLDEIRERAEKATPEIMRIHREMLDICTMNFYDRDSTWFYTWISEWFNAIKQFWPFEDIPFLLDEITRLRAELDAAVRQLQAVKDCHTCAYYIREYGMGAIECKKPCATTKNENYEWRGTEVQE